MNTENLSSVYFRDGKPCNEFDQHLFTAVLLQAHTIACPSAPISNLTHAWRDAPKNTTAPKLTSSFRLWSISASRSSWTASFPVSFPQ